MYCPPCGTQNNEDVRFCRKCGGDLRLVSQALTRRISWWKYIAAKIDDRVEAKRRKEDYNKGLVEIYHSALIIIIATVLTIFSFDFIFVFLILIGVSLLGFGLRDYWIYRRRLKYEYHPDPLEIETQLGDLSIYKPEPPASKEKALRTSEIGDRASAAPTASLSTASPPSITEQTTQHLDRAKQENGS
jgi:hypothetical protein